MFLAIDGIDGSGKTSVATALAKELRSKGRSVKIREHPGDGFFGRRCRALLLKHGKVPLMLSSLALFMDMLGTSSDLKAARRDGSDLIVVRYGLSCLFIDGRKGKTVKRLFDGFMPSPDASILIDTDPEVAIGRISSRGSEQEVFENISSMTRVRAAMLSSPGIVVIDGNGAPSEILSAILPVAESLLRWAS